MSEMSEKDMEGFLSQPLIARLATVGDGEPYVAPMWFLYEDGVIVMSTGRDSKKVENIRQNPKVAVAIDTTQGGFAFQGVIVRGRAELQEGEIKETSERIMEKYVGLEHPLAEKLLNLPRVIIRVEPRRLITFDYSGQKQRT